MITISTQKLKFNLFIYLYWPSRYNSLNMIPDVLTIIATYLTPLQLLTSSIPHTIKLNYNASEFKMTPSTINYIFNHFPNITITGIHITPTNDYYKQYHIFDYKKRNHPSQINKTLSALKILKSEYNLDAKAFMNQCQNLHHFFTNVNFNNITNIANVTHNLHSLCVNIKASQIDHIRHKFPNLRHLRIINPIYDVSQLGSYINLRSLTLTIHVQYDTNLFPLQSCTSLQILKLKHCIGQISCYPLQSLKLKRLILYKCANIIDTHVLTCRIIKK